jgi:monofunctional biosynthetic peptidoglycan transglycosylase
MFKINLFWSDHFTRGSVRGKRARRANTRVATAVRGLGIGLAGVFAAVLLLIALLRWLPIPTSAFMLEHRINGHRAVHHWVPWSKIAKTVPIAVVAAEDQRFPDHWGFDFAAIEDALRANQRRSSPRGASTISQQVAKNLFLWSGKTWVRKGLEAVLTITIELCWSKQRILEVYLNIAQFGPNTFGVAAAARRYFGTSPARLSQRQAALLAAVLPDPVAYSLSPPSAYVRQRAADIQEQVRLLGGPAYLAKIQ